MVWQVMYPNSQWASREPRSPLAETQRWLFSWFTPTDLQRLQGRAVWPRCRCRSPRPRASQGARGPPCPHRWRSRTRCRCSRSPGTRCLSPHFAAQMKTGERQKPVTIQIHTNLVWTGKKCYLCEMSFRLPHYSNMCHIYVTHTRTQTQTKKP